MEATNNKPAKSSVSAILVMLCTFISRILGYVKIAVIAGFFGATGKADVLNAVFSIPNNLRKLMAEGALSSAFIPVLTESLIKEKDKAVTKGIVRNILAFQVVIIVPLCVLSIVFADFLMTKVFLQFSDPYLSSLAIDLFRWFISYLLLISISAAVMAVLNTLGHFFIPAISPILFSITVVLGIVFFHEYLGIFSMVIGVLSGGLLQVIFQLPVFLKEGYDLKLNFNFNNHYFKKIMKNWFPVLVTASVFTINSQIAIRFASGLETGSSSALSYAIVFWQFPFGIFSASITTVLFPKMSRLAASNNTKELLETVNTGIIQLYSLLLPSGIFIFVMGNEIISIAMQRGAFTAENTALTAFVLRGYAAGIFAAGFFNFLQRFYYSVHNYKKSFIFAIIVCIIDVILSIILKETFLRVGGLAIANTIAFSIGAILMFIDVKKSYPLYDLRLFLKGVAKITLALIIPTILMIFSRTYFDNLWVHGLNITLLIYFLFTALLFSAMVLFFYKIFKIDFIFFLKRRSIK
ncbi:MAG: murein biosynthesis integral membrane protein MurJ [Spirochaetes bacterium]|nr:murein biosynthesis integral membrane protein MurJ [Spirochaetota bacterium]